MYLMNSIAMDVVCGYPPQPAIKYGCLVNIYVMDYGKY
jgi:hypothetical protein